MKIVLPVVSGFTRVRVSMDPPMTDEAFEELCRLNEPWKRIERTREGVIEVMSPTGTETGDGNSEVTTQLRIWWKTHRRGRVYDSATGFHLPDDSILSPDASYVAEERLSGLSKKDREGFAHVCPNFVIELRSKSDRVNELKRKMERWRENGAELGWLIDSVRRCVLVYEGSGTPREEHGACMEGSGPVEGFRLDLSEVWECYEG